MKIFISKNKRFIRSENDYGYVAFTSVAGGWIEARDSIDHLGPWELLFDSNPMTPPEFGQYVEFTLRNGDTVTGEVKSVETFNGYWEMELVNPLSIVSLSTPKDPDPLPSDAVSWREVERPAKVWKVGDVVPANTAVGKRWMGEYVENEWNVVAFQAEDRSWFDRRIIKIEED